MDWAEIIDPIGRLLPTGVCDNRPLERVLRRLFSMHGRTNDFRKLAARLYIVATDLNTGHSVRFGEPGLDDCRSRARSRRAPHCPDCIRQSPSTAVFTPTARCCGP